MTTNKPQLIILDDNVTFVSLLIRLLKRELIEIHHSSNAIDCLETIDRVDPSHLIVDYRMPKIDGPKFLLMLKSQGYNDQLKIFLNSGSVIPDDVMESLSPMSVKSVTKDDLLDIEFLRNGLGLNAI